MWCKTCRQDVPGRASFDEGGYACARCGSTLAADPALLTATLTANLLDQGIDLAAQDEPAPQLAPPPCSLDDWEVEDQLRQADRALRQRPRMGVRTASSEKNYRFDPPQIRLEPLGMAAAPRGTQQSEPSPRARKARRSGSRLGMLATSLGFTGFACGGVLLGWAWLEDRPELWNLGLPITLVGQCLMLVGLLLQLERLWRSGGDTADKLQEVDLQLYDLQHAARALSTSEAGPARAFYTHYSAGASPHVLLADLKGQFDLLAEQLHRR